MPRKSATASAVVMLAPKHERPRLRAPEDLTDAQRAVWVSTTNALPADWFGQEHAPLLRRFCAHTARADQIERAMANLDPLADLDAYRKLGGMATAESGKIAALARAMRLTQQSRLKAETASNKSRGGGTRAGINELLEHHQ